MSSNFFKRFRKGNKATDSSEADNQAGTTDATTPVGADTAAPVESTDAVEARQWQPETDLPATDTLSASDSSAPEAASSDPETVSSEPEAASSSEEAAGGFFARFKKRKPETADTDSIGQQADAEDEDVVQSPSEAPLADLDSGSGAVQEQDKPTAKTGFFARMRAGLSRTSSNFAEGLGNLFLGKKEIDEELLEDIETQLLVADVGLDATTEIIDNLTDRVARKQLADADALYDALKTSLTDLLNKVESPLQLPAKQPAVILVVGVNGVGKTTTIGKLARRLQAEGKSVMLAAGDTFRAAAVEQLQVWGERNQVPVVAQHTGADSASVIFDAVSSAQARGVDVVIADTAGRLHNKSNLMEELSKVKRVMAKLDVSAPHEVLLVLDAGTGQNALNQAEQFIEAAGVTGIALTKLDGTAKGGVIFALSQKFGLPVRFIGVGEGVDDLQAFNAQAFVEALFEAESSQ